MKLPRRLLSLASILLLAMGAAACPDCGEVPPPDPASDCDSTDDCPAGYECHPSLGYCYQPQDGGSSSVDGSIDAAALDSGGESDGAQPDAQTPDGAVPDGAVPDSATSDGALPDGASPDSSQPDSSQPDGAQPDGALPDAASPDSTMPDAAQFDSAQPDSATPDSAMPDAHDPCGDGTIDPGEQCDDGNTQAGDGCSDTCTDEVTPACGDGILQAGEGCDDGDAVLVDDCPDGPAGSCVPAYCSDGYLHIPAYGGSEECDDGNSATSDGCDDSCQLELASCGDGNPQGGEECDLGTASNSDTASGDCATVCRTDCTCPGCGDGVTDYALGEECDDWNVLAGDGCGATCTIEHIATCGDGQLDLDQGEQCDDGGTAAGDGCSPTCQLEPASQTCGDDSTDTGEVCDDGMECHDGTPCTDHTTCNGQTPDDRCLPRNGDGCNPTCRFLGELSVFLDAAGGAVTMTVDETYLWMANESSGEISRLHIQDCIDDLGQVQSCSSEAVLTGLTGAGSMATDGNTLWFGFSHGGTEGPYIVALGIAACEGAGLPCDGSGATRIAAGTSAWGGHSDGVGTSAGIAEIRALTYFAGLVYFLDSNHGTLRRLDPVTGSVLTLVGPPDGSGTPTATEGYGASARLASPRYMASDNSGFLYVTDNADDRIYRYNVLSGYLERWVGDGTRGYTDALDGASAQLSRPRDITSDGTSMFWAAYNNMTVREAEVVSSRVTTLVGKVGVCGDVPGTGVAAEMGQPFGIVYHWPTSSLFVSGGNGSICTGLTPHIWRVQ